MRLSSLAPHPQHDAQLEQYATEGDLAARWLGEIHTFGDLEGRPVVDVGAGNGILGLGAMLLGASSLLMVEADQEVLAVAGSNAELLGLEATLLCRTLSAEEGLPTIEGSTVVANPPWGFQAKGADRPVLEGIFSSDAEVVHLMHHAEAVHVVPLAHHLGWQAEDVLVSAFRLPPVHAHQGSGRRSTDVICRRFTRA